MVSTLKTTTHDASLAGFHMADFSSFLSHLTDAVTAAWPDRFTMRYRKVKVLLMSWDRDDLEVEPEARKLESVFRGLYHYDTEYWKIPSRRSAVELSRKVADLVDEHGQEGNLLILYYGGHARPSEQPGGSPVWAANRSRDSPTVQSSILHSFLGEVDCDVLLLHDCFHTQENKDTFIGNGVVETLAAGGLEPALTEANNHSFTASLVQELAHAAHTTDWLPVVELHRRIINRMHAWTPKISFVNDAYSLVQVDRRTGQPLFEPPRRRTPVHSFLSRQPKTIVLTPLPPHAQGQPEESLILLNPPGSQSHQTATSQGPSILVTCRLRDQHIDTEKWKQWLHNAPEEARSIQISALFPGFGTVLILELPLAVWDLLPPLPAVSFIAYTSGSNHISEFRRALLGSDPDVSTDNEDEINSDDESGSEKRHKKTNRKDLWSAKQLNETHHHPSLWPDFFENNRAVGDLAEDMPYCLTLAEMQGDDKTSKAARIIRAFVQEADEPSRRYLYDEIQDFCAPASFETLSCSDEFDSNLVAILDEPLPSGAHPRRKGMTFLTSSQLYEALASRAVPQLIDTESKDDDKSGKKSLIYLTNLDPASTLALAATASERQTFPLRTFIYKHLSFQSGMEVKLQSSGQQGFHLSFHLPFVAWRQDTQIFTDSRRGGHGGPLRQSRDIGSLTTSIRRFRTYIHEAQFSCLIVGVHNRHWTAYGAFDTYYDGGESKHDVRSYQTTQGGAVMDPLTCGHHMADNYVVDAREYFLRVMESCVLEVKEEWENTGRQIMKALKPHPMTDASRRTQWLAHQAIQLLEQLTRSLDATILAWERFKETDLAYFDLDKDATTTTIRNIDDSIRGLGALLSTLQRQTDSLKLVTSQISTLASHQTTVTSNALLTVAVSFLPFTLTALLLHAHPLNMQPLVPASAEQQQQHPLTPARYLAASAIISCAAAGVFLVVANWAAAGDKVSGVLQLAREAVTGRRKPVEGERFGFVAARGDKQRVRDAGKGGKGGRWLGWSWWAEGGTDGHGKNSYKYLPEEVVESEDDGVGRGKGLPF